MTAIQLRQQKNHLRQETARWHLGSIGLLALAVLVNMALENARKEDTAQYQDRLAWAEHVRDMAVQELGAISLQQEKERMAREKSRSLHSRFQRQSACRTEQLFRRWWAGYENPKGDSVS